ncbi:electron transport complex subunit RsxC [Porphyromonadaceae bacterium]
MKTFKIGGAHPPENKLSAGKPTKKLELPNQAIISLAQNLGAPSIPLVKKGDKVKVGTVIAKPGAFVGAYLHSSVSGTVAKIDDVMDISGYKRSAVIIDVEGDEWEEEIDTSDELITECTLGPHEIIQKIEQAGIVGLGGATFPSHVKLSPPPGYHAEVLIINAVECEPYLTSDHQLMLEHPAEIIIGVELLMEAIQVSKAYIGVEDNKPDAINLLIKEAKKRNKKEIWIVPLKVQYPQGGEKQLIDAVIERQVPSGKLPVSVGAVVQNVGTVYAVYQAIQKNRPLIDRVVTVTGKKMSDPSNLQVRIGTPIKQLIDAAGGVPENTDKIVSGGPMMGKALSTIDVATTKGCSGILLIPSLEAQRKEMNACIRCAKCVRVCPMGLEPYLLMTATDKVIYEKCEKERIMDCIECGCCSFTCPSNRPLLDYIRLGKNKVGTLIRSRK